jgi:hypothetical protein
MHEIPDFASGERSLLKIEPIGVPPYSVRGVRQSLRPIGGDIHRTANGALVDFTAPQFRLYQSTISCRDQETPAIDGVFPGDIVTVHCAVELRYKVGNPGSPHRPMVEGSDREEDGFVYYRPILEMMFMGWNTQIAEWDGEVQWAFDLQEVGGPASETS